MKRYVFYILLFSFVVQGTLSLGQNYFLKTYSDFNAFYPFSAYHIRETNNKEFVMESEFFPGITGLGLFLKIDSLGNVLAYKQYYPNLTNSSRDADFTGIETTDDSTYLVIGNYEIPAGNIWQGILMKLNPDGSIVWCKEPSAGYLRDFNGIYKTLQNNFVIYIKSGGSVILTKVDKHGNILNNKTISDSGGGALKINKMKLTHDDGLIMGGKQDSALLIRTDSLFNPVFSVWFPGHFSILNVLPTFDGGFLALLDDDGSSLDTVFTLIKTDSLGNIAWSIKFSDSTKYFFPKVLFENADQTFYCIVNWLKFNATLYNYNTAIIKMDSDGNILEIKDSLVIQFYEDLIRTSDGRYCSLFGRGPNNSYRPAVMMSDSLFSQTYASPCFVPYTSSINYNAISATTINLPLSTSNNGINFQNINFYDTSGVMNVTSCIPLGVDELNASSTFEIYPNPCTDIITIKLEGENIRNVSYTIKNMYGQSVYMKKTNRLTGELNEIVDVRFLANGIYLFELNMDGDRKVKKFVKNKT